MYGSLPAHTGAAQPGSSVAEQPATVSATLMESAGARDGTSITSVLALEESAPADVQPTTTEQGAPTLPPRDTPPRRAERALALLTATCASLSAKHADAEDPFYDHAASICKLAHGQLMRLDASSFLESTALFAFHQQPGCASRALKAALEAGHLPKKEEQGQG
ncbi:g11416 [Coccomyxa elongata]